LRLTGYIHPLFDHLANFLQGLKLLYSAWICLVFFYFLLMNCCLMNKHCWNPSFSQNCFHFLVLFSAFFIMNFNFLFCWWDLYILMLFFRKCLNRNFLNLFGLSMACNNLIQHCDLIWAVCILAYWAHFSY